LSEEQKQKLLMYFSEPTKYGLINAVANLASQTRNVEEQIRLEELGGRILASKDILPEVGGSYGGGDRTLLSYL
jgi:hypothetical protein